MNTLVGCVDEPIKKCEWAERQVVVPHCELVAREQRSICLVVCSPFEVEKVEGGWGG
jgi:hypothetical protein